MKKSIILLFVVSLMASSSIAQWCITCFALPSCGPNALYGTEVFCGSYDGSTGCWSYFRKPDYCPGNPGDPIVRGDVVRTEWKLGFVCTTGNDCY
jgi:hypothetical protein